MMRIFLLIAALLSCSLAIGAPEPDPVTQLLGVVADTNKPPEYRANAIDDLGKLGPKGLGSHLPAVVDQLSNVLLSQSCPNSGDYLRWHAANALANIGPPARGALAALARIPSTDPTLLAARDAAVAKITAAPSAPAAADKPADANKPAPAPAAATASTNVLSNLPTESRLAALKNLQANLKSNPASVQAMLTDIAALMTGKASPATGEQDPDVRRLATQITWSVISAPKANTQNFGFLQFASNLSDQSKNTTDQKELLFIVSSLSDVIKQQNAGAAADLATGACTRLAGSTDKLVAAAANAANAAPAKPAAGGGNPPAQNAPGGAGTQPAKPQAQIVSCSLPSILPAPLPTGWQDTPATSGPEAAAELISPAHDSSLRVQRAILDTPVAPRTTIPTVLRGTRVITKNPSLVPTSNTAIRSQEATAEQCADFVSGLEQQLQLYPAGSVEKLRLKYIVLCQALHNSTGKVSGLFDWTGMAVYYDVSAYSGVERDKLIHHELFHAIDNHLGKLSYDFDWTSITGPASPGYLYDKGAAIHLYKQDRSAQPPGFLNNYARADAAEDKAVLFAALVTGSSGVFDRTKEDATLRRKVDSLKRLLQVFDGRLDGKFWNSLKG